MNGESTSQSGEGRKRRVRSDEDGEMRKCET